MDSLISKQAAIELIHSLYPSEPIMPMNRKWWKKKYKPYIEAEKALEMLPSAQPEPSDVARDISTIIENEKDMRVVLQQPRWVLCGDRMPEAEYPVIVTWKNNDPKSYYQYILGKHYVGVAHYKNGKWFWYSSITEDVLMEYGRCEAEEFDEAIEVIAWVKLPDPYKGENT